MAKLTQEDLDAIRDIVVEAVKETVTSTLEDARAIELQSVAQVVTECYKAMMDQEVKEVVQVHGRLLQTVAMIEDVSAREELDVSTMAEEAYKRVYALSVMMAERSVEGAQSSLAKIKEYIEEAREMVAFAQEGHSSWYKGKNGFSLSKDEWESRLRELLKQEKSAEERLTTERKRLANLILSS